MACGLRLALSPGSPSPLNPASLIRHVRVCLGGGHCLPPRHVLEAALPRPQCPTTATWPHALGTCCRAGTTPRGKRGGCSSGNTPRLARLRGQAARPNPLHFPNGDPRLTAGWAVPRLPTSPGRSPGQRCLARRRPHVFQRPDAGAGGLPPTAAASGDESMGAEDA